MTAARIRRWWREDRPFYYARWPWRIKWLGQGWNCLQVGPVRWWFASGPTPAARIRSRLGR